MRMQLIMAGLLSSAWLATVAVAQGQPPAPPAGNAQPPIGSTETRPADSRFVTQEGSQGVLRLSDIIGQDTIGLDNKTNGKVEDVVLDRDGKVAAYVIEVGGALGIGSRTVAVPASFIQVKPVETTATTGTLQNQGLPPSTSEGQRTRSDIQVSRVLTPSKIVMSMPADQLKAAPAFVSGNK